jgi:hypothetical protein
LPTALQRLHERAHKFSYGISNGRAHEGAHGSTNCGAHGVTDVATYRHPHVLANAPANSHADVVAHRDAYGYPLEGTNFGSYKIAILRRLHRSGSPRMQNLCSNHRVQPF